jgi:hypothetical protein
MGGVRSERRARVKTNPNDGIVGRGNFLLIKGCKYRRFVLIKTYFGCGTGWNVLVVAELPKCTPFGDGVIARKLHQNDNWRFAL